MFCAVGEIISGGSRNSDDLCQRITPGFPGFGLNGIENSLPPAEDQVVKAADNARAAGEWQLLPKLLGLPRPRCRLPDAGWSRIGYLPNNFPGCRILNFDNVSFVWP